MRKWDRSDGPTVEDLHHAGCERHTHAAGGVRLCWKWAAGFLARVGRSTAHPAIRWRVRWWWSSSAPPPRAVADHDDLRAYFLYAELRHVPSTPSGMEGASGLTLYNGAVSRDRRPAATRCAEDSGGRVRLD